MQVMSAILADTFTNELKKRAVLKDQQLDTTLIRKQHDKKPDDIEQSFRISRECQNKFDCLIFETFFYQGTNFLSLVFIAKSISKKFLIKTNNLSQ